MDHAILLISCPDTRGITAAVTGFVYENNGNIIHADQHIDDQQNVFFMRIEWSLDGFSIERNDIEDKFSGIAGRFNMDWQLLFSNDVPNVAVFVSKHMHCLNDILLRHRAGQLSCNISAIISNHEDASKIAGAMGIDYFNIPITKDNKAEQEKRELSILEKKQVELVILARYHQLLTPAFVDRYKNRIINIHHSFLPAFAGEKAYLQAYNKGVKIIGATSHYVTADLDQGPIIEQDTVRISHRDTVSDLILKGEDLEKIVLNRAVRWHLERKILCYGNKTVIFD